MNPLVTHQETVRKIDNAATAVRAKYLRESAGISQRQLAERMGVSPSFLCDLELARRNWTDVLAHLFAEALKEPVTK